MADSHHRHQCRLRRLRRRHRLPDGRRAPARSGRLPRCSGREPGARVHGVRPHAGAGRPAAPQSVVGMDTRRLLAAPGGTGQRPRRSREPSRRPDRLRGRRGLRGVGRAWLCPRRRSGSTPPAAAPRRLPTPGGTNRKGRRSPVPITGTGISRGGPRTATASPRPSARSPSTGTVSPTWRATSGSGPRTGTSNAAGPTSRRAACHAIHAEPFARRATTGHSHRSAFPAKSSRAARSCARTTTACVTDPQRDGPRWSTPA